ncbi:hypothetical protein BT63DRAFT_308805 [Microthyrium microscopicum]|uniref:BTB domain-containing protein n=1 Tax=Microthyrium microscopicum TaxID=703497 RepID=A0A6A6U7F5_9PEZI|nr:hypothetical protein BT63DRAFT_308805 [Microthyrium microscopicum]
MAPISTSTPSAAVQAHLSGTQPHAIRRPTSQRPNITASITKVLVGMKEDVFMVHTETLRSSSGFFQAMLRAGANFKENVENQVKLPDCDSKIFTLYVEFLYTGKLFTQLLESADITVHEERRVLVGLLKLADFLQDETLHNAAIDYLTNPAGFPISLVALAHKNLPKDSQLIRLLLFKCIHGTVGTTYNDGQDHDIESCADLSEFWWAVAKGKEALLNKIYLENKGKPDPIWSATSGRCTYHVHKDGKMCE